MRKARKLRALLLSDAAGEFQGLPEAVSIPTNGCVLAASTVDSEVGVLQTLLANQTLCLFIVNSTLCNNPADHHAAQEHINVDEQAKVFKKLFEVEDCVYTPLRLHRNRRLRGQQFFGNDLSKFLVVFAETVPQQHQVVFGV